MRSTLEGDIVTDLRSHYKGGREDAAEADIAALASYLDTQNPRPAAGPSDKQIETFAVAMTTLLCGLDKFGS